MHQYGGGGEQGLCKKQISKIWLATLNRALLGIMSAFVWRLWEILNSLN